MAMHATPLEDARKLFGEACIGPGEVASAFGVDAASLANHASVPYDLDTLRAAHGRSELLILRIETDSAGPLTLLRLYERFPSAFRAKAMKEGVGYLLKDEWTLEQEDFTKSATCRAGWHLVHREPIAETTNLTYELQEAALDRYAARIGLRGTLRRRSAIEIVYDVLVFHLARGERLLERSWDWSDTPSADGGFMTAGEFTAAGLQVIGYSHAVRFGTLGICAQH